MEPAAVAARFHPRLPRLTATMVCIALPSADGTGPTTWPGPTPCSPAKLRASAAALARSVAVSPEARSYTITAGKIFGDWKRDCTSTTLVDSALAGSHVFASFFSAPVSLADNGRVTTSTATQNPTTSHLVQPPAGTSASLPALLIGYGACSATTRFPQLVMIGDVKSERCPHGQAAARNPHAPATQTPGQDLQNARKNHRQLTGSFRGPGLRRHAATDSWLRRDLGRSRLPGQSDEALLSEASRARRQNPACAAAGHRCRASRSAQPVGCYGPSGPSACEASRQSRRSARFRCGAGRGNGCPSFPPGPIESTHFR